jgi:ABC-type Fe3+/spermidine/putrescine transport system ATPase subunit
MLQVQDLVVRYDAKTVLHNIQLTVARGEIVCLLGASGCGKTTLLRTIAGLELPTQGDIRIDDGSIVKTPVHRRGFGLMFQDFALFPHMNVLQNVAFGLRMQGQSKAQQLHRAREVLNLVGLADFEARDVSQLSGGEKQRVALARSLAPNPRLLMLDEPLGSLDAAFRERLALDLRQIIKQVGLTAIYVTHDQQEAFAIADRIAVMNAGRIEQIAAPDTLYQAPETVFVAQFLGLNNIISGALAAKLLNDESYLANEQYLVHPDCLILVSDEDGHLYGEVIERVFMGNAYRLRIRIIGDGIPHQTEFITRVINRHVPNLGDSVHLRVETRLIYLRSASQ